MYWRSYEGVRWMITAYRAARGASAREQAPRRKEEPQNGTDRAAFIKDMFR